MIQKQNINLFVLYWQTLKKEAFSCLLFINKCPYFSLIKLL